MSTDEPLPTPWWPPKYIVWRFQIKYQFAPWIIENRELINAGMMRVGFEWRGWRWVSRVWVAGQGGGVLDSQAPAIKVTQIEEI